ncbi:hypothetical protein [Pseudofrankia asymbiotica]|uniref:hypothetical protein n=1 Tax=Pseudofrankia asymbiotica TaxID=1834516 RepID=UPI001054411D|nr:hypothetical protein [Pseudofrankia asymbiotica]
MLERAHPGPFLADCPPGGPAPAMPRPALDRFVERDLKILIKECDASPIGLARHAPGLLVVLTGRRTSAAAPAAHKILVEAVEALAEPAAHAARALLGIGKSDRETLTKRRKTAAEPYGVGPTHFRREYEPDVIMALVIALLARADPLATYPGTRGIPSRVPPPFSAFVPRYRRASRALRNASKQPCAPAGSGTVKRPAPGWAPGGVVAARGAPSSSAPPPPRRPVADTPACSGGATGTATPVCRLSSTDGSSSG